MRQGYKHKPLEIIDVDKFYVVDPSYEGVPVHTYGGFPDDMDQRFPLIFIKNNNSRDITILSRRERLDIERVCYDGKRIYSYTPWVKIQRRIGFFDGIGTELERYREKYKDRNVVITDDKYDMGVAVKSAIKR